MFSQLIYYMFQCHKILSLTILSSPTVTCMSRNVALRLNFQYSFGYITGKKKKILIGKDTRILVFTAILFTIAKTKKQPKCPSIHR